MLEKVVSGGTYSPRNLLVWCAAVLSQHTGLEADQQRHSGGYSTSQPGELSVGALHLAIG